MAETRKDYGPAGCAEFALLPALVALMVALVRRPKGGKR